MNTPSPVLSSIMLLAGILLCAGCTEEVSPDASPIAVHLGGAVALDSGYSVSAASRNTVVGIPIIITAYHNNDTATAVDLIADSAWTITITNDTTTAVVFGPVTIATGIDSIEVDSGDVFRFPTYTWDQLDTNGTAVPSGFYVITLYGHGVELATDRIAIGSSL